MSKEQKVFIVRGSRKIFIDASGRYIVNLVRQGAEVEVLGVFKGRGRDQIEIDIEVNHRAVNTSANTHIRGVVRDQATARVEGTIRIFEGAQKTNSFLTEKILILSDKARAEAVPNLEIEADDVHCSHAATVGKIDEEQLFYLMSRGLQRIQAEELIVEGFLAPVTLAEEIGRI